MENKIIFVSDTNMSHFNPLIEESGYYWIGIHRISKDDVEKLMKASFDMGVRYSSLINKVKDTITISYTKPNEVIPTTKTFTSDNYKYWYKHTCDKDPIRNVEIKSANIKIDNVTYKNVDDVLVNGESVIDGIRDGHVEVEVEL